MAFLLKGNEEKIIPESIISAVEAASTVKVVSNSSNMGPSDTLKKGEEEQEQGPYLDDLGIIFTAVKVLYIQGCLSVLPWLVNLIEPIRTKTNLNKDLHLTHIRNENAYYIAIAQLLSLKKIPVELRTFQTPEGGIDALSPNTNTNTNTNNNTTTNLMMKNAMYVCGDSHCLSPAWEVIQQDYNNQKNQVLIMPVLVTGLKIWHLRNESSFYTKTNFYNAVKLIPKGSRVIFLFGEIDCREGILLAVQKLKYDTVEEAMKNLVKIYVKVLLELKDKYGFEIYVHPVPPVLDHTRENVLKFNSFLEKAVKKEKGSLHWMDFCNHLLLLTQIDNKQINSFKPEFQLDGTHIHPSYVNLWWKI